VVLPVTASLKEASATMGQHGLRRLPIVDETGRVAGLVAFDDIVLLLGIELGDLATAIFRGLASPAPDARAMADALDEEQTKERGRSR
jgi:CBS domain-containing protein